MERRAAQNFIFAPWRKTHIFYYLLSFIYYLSYCWFSSFLRIGLPLLKPTLVTVGITVVVAMYNDYSWPTIALTGGDDMKTFCQIVFNAASGIARTDLGLVAASFILGTIPLMLITCSCLKYYLEGMVAGAVKG